MKDVADEAHKVLADFAKAFIETQSHYARLRELAKSHGKTFLGWADCNDNIPPEKRTGFPDESKFPVSFDDLRRLMACGHPNTRNCFEDVRELPPKFRGQS